MPVQIKLPKNLMRKELFWDVDPSSIDVKKHARFIIERVLSRGLLSDWEKVKELYSLEEIKGNAVRIRSMDRKLLTFCSTIFNIPKEEFHCYRNNAFYPTH